jgi:hypothetical protein
VGSGALLAAAAVGGYLFLRPTPAPALTDKDLLRTIPIAAPRPIRRLVAFALSDRTTTMPVRGVAEDRQNG